MRRDAAAFFERIQLTGVALLPDQRLTSMPSVISRRRCSAAEAPDLFIVPRNGGARQALDTLVRFPQGLCARELNRRSGC